MSVSYSLVLKIRKMHIFSAKNVYFSEKEHCKSKTAMPLFL